MWRYARCSYGSAVLPLTFISLLCDPHCRSMCFGSVRVRTKNKTLTLYNEHCINLYTRRLQQLFTSQLTQRPIFYAELPISSTTKPVVQRKIIWGRRFMASIDFNEVIQESRAIAGRTARRRCKFQYVFTPIPL